jgi:hypothetical protein
VIQHNAHYQAPSELEAKKHWQEPKQPCTGFGEGGLRFFAQAARHPVKRFYQ